METPAGYGSGQRLGRFMDPSQPLRPSAGRKFHFREWAGAASGTDHQVKLEVKEGTTLTAKFDVKEAPPASPQTPRP
jgi:hypothetical protein